jgi:hypothetical protein
MRIYCYDRNKGLRSFEASSTVDLSKQDDLKKWIVQETGIQPYSMIFGVVDAKK